MYYDATYVLVLIGVAISIIASLVVKFTFWRYSKTENLRGIRAEEAAQLILQNAGIFDVTIEQVDSQLTDHYSTNEKVLRLSSSVYGNTSVAAIGVAAHECGHAIQHNEEYVPLKLLSLSVPVANIGSWLSWPVILVGLFLESSGLAQVGVVLFMFVVLVPLITLPVEFNASHRALEVLESTNILGSKEIGGARKVLISAAMTYVATLFSTILQFLRLILIAKGGRRR